MGAATVATCNKQKARISGPSSVQKVAEWTGLEPATPGVTGRYSNRLNYHSALWWVLRGSNPRPSPCKGDALPAELSTLLLGGALVYGILEAFASLETRHVTSRNLDRRARLRVASGAGFATLDTEGSETDQGHLIATFKCVCNAVQYCLNSP